MAGEQWKNDGSSSVIDIQPGGPGQSNWMLLDPNGQLDTLSGGGRPKTSLWGRGARGGLSPRGFVLTGNPDDVTGNMSYPYTSENFLKRLDCPFSLRARQYCGGNKGVMTAYANPGMVTLNEAVVTSLTTNNGLSMMDGQGSDVQRQAAVSATLEEDVMQVAHDDISLTTFDVAINRIINIGARVCAGQCGPGATEEDSWLAVTNKDSAPAYSGNPAPYLLWTTDRMVTRNQARIGLFTNADAKDVVLAGDRVVVFSDTKAPAYAKLADIYNGVTDPLLWAASSGFSAISGSNFPKAAVAVDALTILCVGAGGRIWLSTDGGISFTLIYDTGVLTSQNLNAIDAQPTGNAYVGGNSGVFIRLAKTPGANSFTGSLITVKDASLNTLASNINSVRTPPLRGNEVFLGTAGGEIWVSMMVNATATVFENRSIDRKGIGSITDMNFIGYRGSVLYIIQTNTDNTSRVLRDFSGGKLATDVEMVGSFTAPGNFGINSIAPANVNMALTGGNLHGTYAWLGMIRPAQ